MATSIKAMHSRAALFYMLLRTIRQNFSYNGKFLTFGVPVLRYPCSSMHASRHTTATTRAYKRGVDSSMPLMSKTIAGLSLPQKDPEVILDESKTILDLFSLKGKVASVTGSSSGIGFAVAEGYAQAGADVAIWYNSHNPEEKAAAIAKKYGVKVKTYKVQVADSDAVEAAIKEQVKEFGKIDIFVANAGVPWTKGAMIDQPDHEEWNKVMRLDLDGAYYCAKFAGQVFKKQGFGSFIFTASMSGKIVNVPQLQACYNAAKAALIHLSHSLAVEWAGFARCNTICPGYIRTEISDFVPEDIQNQWWALTPMGRGGLAKELVGAYLYLASDAATYTSGADISVDGGYICP